MKIFLLNFLMALFLLVINILDIFQSEIKKYQEISILFSPELQKKLSIVLAVIFILMVVFRSRKQDLYKKILMPLFFVTAIIMIFSYSTPLIAIYKEWGTYADKIIENFYHGSIAYFFGILTSIVYCLLRKWEINDRIYGVIAVPGALLIFIILNTFPFPSELAGIYCLLGSFCGSELLHLHESKKSKCPSNNSHSCKV